MRNTYQLKQISLERNNTDKIDADKLCQAFKAQILSVVQQVDREPLFRRSAALALFDRVFREARLRFVFTARDLRLEDDWLSFYIKPEEGLELPAIMKWLKQTFARSWMGSRRRGRRLRRLTAPNRDVTFRIRRLGMANS